MDYEAINQAISLIMGVQATAEDTPAGIYSLSKLRKDGESLNDVANRIISESEQTPNSLDDKVENYNENHDHLGRFASGGGAGAPKAKGGYDGLSPYSFTEKLDKEYGKQATFDGKDKAAISSYAGTDYLNVNGALTHPSDTRFDHQSAKEVITGLHGAMKNTLVKDTTLYRGIGTSNELKVGTVITNKGFSSTTTNLGVAKEFAVHGVGFSETKRPVVLHINAQKGLKGVWPQLSSSNSADTTLRSNEQEFLLPDNLSFKIKSVHDMGNYEIAEVNIV